MKAKEKRRLKLLKPRECGQCRACCSVLDRPMPTGPEPAGTPCVHLRPAPEKGCGIHATRPEDPCRIFQCVWINSPEVLEGAERPDRLGVLLDCKELPFLGDGAEGVIARETRPGAFETADALAVFDRLVRNGNFVLCVSGSEYYGRVEGAKPILVHHVFGPKDLLAKWEAFDAEHGRDADLPESQNAKEGEHAA